MTTASWRRVGLASLLGALVLAASSCAQMDGGIVGTGNKVDCQDEVNAKLPECEKKR